MGARALAAPRTEKHQQASIWLEVQRLELGASDFLELDLLGFSGYQYYVAHRFRSYIRYTPRCYFLHVYRRCGVKFVQHGHLLLKARHGDESNRYVPQFRSNTMIAKKINLGWLNLRAQSASSDRRYNHKKRNYEGAQGLSLILHSWAEIRPKLGVTISKYYAKSFKHWVLNPYAIYLFLYTACAILGVVVTPYFYAFHLSQIILRSRYLLFILKALKQTIVSLLLMVRTTASFFNPAKYFRRCSLSFASSSFCRSSVSSFFNRTSTRWVLTRTATRCSNACSHSATTAFRAKEVSSSTWLVQICPAFALRG